MKEKQRTIKTEVTLEGVGLHTGCRVRVTLKPAPEHSGIRFVRTDLPERPVVKAAPENIRPESDMPRCTGVGNEKFSIYTVEHLMSALWGAGITNVIVEMNERELPGLDGSAIDFLTAVQKAGVAEQTADAPCLEVYEPITVEKNGCAITIYPSTDLRISYALDYPDAWVGAQFFHQRIDKEFFAREIAPCRTFCLESEANELQSQGLGLGANYQNTLVITKDGVKDNQTRFGDEFARHKVLDFIGDLYLLGMPIKGQVFAMKSGHYLNIQLLRAILKQHQKYQKRQTLPVTNFAGKREFDITAIMKILPHRYPFLLVDRVVELEEGKRAVGIKNVTINDNFFQGHFPSRPVMPGVLMVEAMAQTAGVLILTKKDHHGKVAFFMSTDNVKFRKVVVPGDQLVMEVELVRDRARTAQVHGVGRVGDEIAVEADMVFSFVSAEYLTG